MAGRAGEDNGGEMSMAADPYRLVIGDKTYSSWSLRPWLAMTYFGIPFVEEHVVLRHGAETKQAILRHSPSAKVPCLRAGGIVVWDSLAILEFLAERFPDMGFWPEAEAARAEARAVSAEMHSGFQALRNDMPMDLSQSLPAPPIGEDLRHNIVRVVGIWSGARKRFGASGPFLFGNFSIADAMYAPVATRFDTYGVNLAEFGDDGLSASYGAMLLSLPEFHRWKADAAAERQARAGV
jgi:glutathione S-transferase